MSFFSLQYKMSATFNFSIVNRPPAGISMQRADPGKKGAVGYPGSKPCCNQFRGLNMYRKTLTCRPCETTTQIYKDNASLCPADVCYTPPTIKSKNNNTIDGVTTPDLLYNYTSHQYLRRKCKSYVTNNSTLEYDSATHLARTPCCDEACATGTASQAKNACCITYKPNNTPFMVQGAVESSNRLERLKYDTISRGRTYDTTYQGRNGCCGTQPYSSQTQNINIHKKFPCSRRLDILRQNKVVCTKH
jgi:hypothetical protein